MKLKLKKSLMLTALASIATIGTIAPFVVTACGNGNSATIKPGTPSTPGGSGTPGGTDKPSQPDQPKPSEPTGDTLPENYTEAQYESAINAYSAKVDQMSVNQMISEMNTLANELTQANTPAFDGFNEIINWTVPKINQKTGEQTGGWALNDGKTIENVYNFFANRVGNVQLFPTWQNFDEFFNLNSSVLIGNNWKIKILLFSYMFNKSLFNANKILLLNIRCIDNLPKKLSNVNIDSTDVQTIKNFCEILGNWELDYIYSICLHINNSKLKAVKIDSTIIKYHDFVNSFITKFFDKCKTSGINTGLPGTRYLFINETNGYGYIWPQLNPDYTPKPSN